MMYWVEDSKGRVLGPTQLQTVKELVLSGRFMDLARVSRDGRTWVDASLVPEVAELVGEPNPETQRAAAQAQTEKALEYLERIRRMPAHEIFKVAEDASLEEYRAAFFSTVKRFYPDRHPEGELRRICESVFLHLAGLMVNLEKARLAPTRAQALIPTIAPVLPAKPANSPAEPPTQRSSRPTAEPESRRTTQPAAGAPPHRPSPTANESLDASPRPPARAGREVNTYEPAEFLGLRWKDDRLEASLRVSRRDVGMFTSHPLANFKMNSFFVPGQHQLRLGTLMDLTLKFEDPQAEIRTRAKVFLENSGHDARQPAGVGVRFFTLLPKDQDFIQAFIRNAR